MEPLDRRIQELDEALKAAAFGLAILLTISGGANAADLRCTPTLPVFCANVHVGCAGRTTLPTHGFAIAADQIAYDDGTVWDVTRASSDSGDVYRRKGARDWIRVDPEGRFSQRVYLGRGPVMAFGVCR